MKNKGEKKSVGFERVDSRKIITRIAPSPTGSFHIGTARTALFNYLFAKQNGGTFIVRFEDTDRERSERRYKREIIESLRWLSLHPDIIVQQSDRKRIYRRYIKHLIKVGSAYTSKESSKKDPTKEVEVVRFKNRESTISFTDSLRGEIKIDISDLGDFVIARSIDDPLYNLAVVIDDLEMNITDIIRGDDHIANTPIQIAIIKAFGGTPPLYTHIPLIHSPDGGKMSKRKGASSIADFRLEGYLPEALINAIALLGWNPKGDREIFTLEELTSVFSLKHIQKKEAVFSEEKLRWFNRQYIKSIAEDRLRREIVPMIVKRFPIRSRLRPRSVKALLAIVREQGLPLSEERSAIHSREYDFFFVSPKYKPEMLLPKTKEGLQPTQKVLTGLRETASLIKGIDAYGGWTEKNIRGAVWDHAERCGKALILWPLRVALSGKEKSPAPFLIAHTIGKKETLLRANQAIKALESIL